MRAVPTCNARWRVLRTRRHRAAIEHLFGDERGRRLAHPMGQRRGDAVKILFRAGLCFLLLVAQASAQNWPNRSVKLMVPTGPGAATDLMARLLADGVSRTIGQAIVVENVPAASGILAHQFVARAQPDGYTLLFTNTS